MTLENISDVPQICSGTLRIAPRALNFLGGGQTPPPPPYGEGDTGPPSVPSPSDAFGVSSGALRHILSLTKFLGTPLPKSCIRPCRVSRSCTPVRISRPCTLARISCSCTHARISRALAHPPGYPTLAHTPGYMACVPAYEPPLEHAPVLLDPHDPLNQHGLLSIIYYDRVGWGKTPRWGKTPIANMMLHDA